MTFGQAIRWALTTAVIAGCSGEPPVPAEHEPRTVHPPEPTEARRALLEEGDRRYDSDEQMLAVDFRSPGYHTRIASGTRVHPTRESLIYALALLQRNRRGDAGRATAIVRRIVGLQDADPSSPTFGVWPWLLEEPLAEMASPDLNWADFCGSQLVHMLFEHPGDFPADLTKSMREALRRAATAIRKRDVGPGYTNIAVLGGVVCVAAGELLDDDDLLEYGRRRLQKVVQYVERNGGFGEYNSPPYSKVIVGECERLLHLVGDPAARKSAESLRQSCWEEIAASFHPATQQWAGPHSRNSRVHLQPTTVEFLSQRTGVALEVHPSVKGGSQPGRYVTVPALPCPVELVPAFRDDVSQPQEIRRAFSRDDSGNASLAGVSWFAADACLGSVNASSFWTQRKPLIAYWRTADDPAVVFRARFLHDGRDFASMGIRTAQTGPRVLCLLRSLQNRGDWHRTLDRPDDGVFHATDLRLRFELLGDGATAKPLEDGRFELAAGERRVVVHTLPGRFAGRNVEWRIGDDGRSVEGICHHGKRRTFDFSRPLEVELCAGVELLNRNEPPTDVRPNRETDSSGRINATWTIAEQELRVEN